MPPGYYGVAAPVASRFQPADGPFEREEIAVPPEGYEGPDQREMC